MDSGTPPPRPDDDDDKGGTPPPRPEDDDEKDGTPPPRPEDDPNYTGTKGPKPPTPGPIMDNNPPDFNFTTNTTAYLLNTTDDIDYLPTSIFTTLFGEDYNTTIFLSTDYEPPESTKEPKGTKGPKETNGPKPPTPGPMTDDKPPKDEDVYKAEKMDDGHPTIHSEQLFYKQTLSLIAMLMLLTLIIFGLLQIKFDKKCYPNFKKVLFRSAGGRTLFALFLISLIMFLINSMVFIFFIFNIHNISDDVYAYTRIFSTVPYRIGKLTMGLFCIFRLHLVFKEASLRLNKYTLIALTALSIIGTILGCIASIVGPLNLIHYHPSHGGINPALLFALLSLGIIIFVDIVVMIYYNQRLRAVVIMQGEVQRRSVTFSKRSTMTKQGMIEEVVPYNKRKSQTFTKSSQLTIDVEMTRKKSQTFTRSSALGIDERQIDEGQTTPSQTIVMDDTSDNENGSEFQWEDFEVVETSVRIDKNMVNTITKSTLLSLIGILTSFWLHLEMIVMAIKGESDGVLFSGIGCVDGGVNVICMYLVFAMNKRYYHRLCRVCHVAMGKCCKYTTRRAVLRAKSVSV